MHDSLAQSYHWTHEDISRLTMPQIILYSHASWVNHERIERKIKAKSGSAKDSPPVDKDPIVPGYNMTMSQLKANEPLFEAYMSDWSGFTV